MGENRNAKIGAILLTERRLIDDAHPNILRFRINGRGYDRRLGFLRVLPKFAIETAKGRRRLAADFHLDASPLIGSGMLFIGADDDFSV